MRAASKIKAQLPQEVAECMTDVEMTRAIQNLTPLLSTEELVKWKPVLDLRLDPRDRAAAWKARRHGKI
jgi:hypothetical protein